MVMYMDSLKELRKKLNELKIKSNCNELEQTNFNSLYEKYTNDKIDIENELVDINEYQRKTLIIEILLIVEILISNIKLILISDTDERKFTQIVLAMSLTLFIASTIDYVKKFKEAKKLYQKYDDIEDNVDKIIIDSHTILSETRKLDKEIERLQIILDEKDEVSAKKYLNEKREI